MLQRVHIDGRGIETNGFVRGPRNEAGLRIPFLHDTGRDIVVAAFSPSRDFGGAPWCSRVVAAE